MANRIARVEHVARAGFFARGIVYMLLGYFALSSSGSDGTAGVMQQIENISDWLLVLVGIGLAGYGFFRLYTAALNLEPQGSGWKGTARRIGHAASGLGHFVLAFTAFQFVVGSGGGGDSQQEAARTVLDLPLGTVLLLLIGLGFLGAAAEQAMKAATAKFMGLLSPDAPPLTEVAGRIGYAARAVVFAIIGYALGKAAFSERGGDVKGLGGALNTLADMGPMFTVTAIGLIFFGLFSLVMARYRTIRDEDVIERLKSMG